MTFRVDSLQVHMNCYVQYDVGQIVMVGYVENELVERIRTSTTVFHGPIQMAFNAPAWESTIHCIVHTCDIRLSLSSVNQVTPRSLIRPFWQAPWQCSWFLHSVVTHHCKHINWHCIPCYVSKELRSFRSCFTKCPTASCMSCAISTTFKPGDWWYVALYMCIALIC